VPFAPGTFFRDFSKELRRDMVVHPVTMEIAELAGRIEGEQATRGVSSAFEDLLIGPTALRLGYAVVTINVRHFQVIPALLSCNSELHNVGREGGRRQQKRSAEM
jgi:predicted nucleic acid-binding protein